MYDENPKGFERLLPHLNIIELLLRFLIPYLGRYTRLEMAYALALLGLTRDAELQSSRTCGSRPSSEKHHLAVELPPASGVAAFVGCPNRSPSSVCIHALFVREEELNGWFTVGHFAKRVNIASSHCETAREWDFPFHSADNGYQHPIINITLFS